MTVQNDFLVFAGAGGANVISQATYAALAALGPGFSAGIAASDQCNKVWRQSSLIAAMVAAFTVDASGLPMVDNGALSTILNNFNTALAQAQFAADTGTANTYAVTFSAGLTVQDGTIIRVRPSHTNTTASTINVDGAGPIAILNRNLAALSGGEIVANGSLELEYNAAHSSWVILSNPGGSVTSISPQIAAYVSSSASVLFQEGTNTISASHTGTGIYTITFGVGMPDTDYCVQLTVDGSTPQYGFVATRNTGSVIIHIDNTTSDALVDANFSILIFR